MSCYKAFDYILNGRVSSFLCLGYHIIWLITIGWIFLPPFATKRPKPSVCYCKNSPYGEATGTMCGAAPDSVQRSLLSCQIYLINTTCQDFNWYPCPFTQSEWLVPRLVFLSVCSDTRVWWITSLSLLTIAASVMQMYILGYSICVCSIFAFASDDCGRSTTAPRLKIYPAEEVVLSGSLWAAVTGSCNCCNEASGLAWDFYQQKTGVNPNSFNYHHHDCLVHSNAFHMIYRLPITAAPVSNSVSLNKASCFRK